MHWGGKQRIGKSIRNIGDGIIDTRIGIGSTILKHIDLIGSTASAGGTVAGAVQSIKDAQNDYAEAYRSYQ